MTLALPPIGTDGPPIGTHKTAAFDPLLTDVEAEQVVRLCETYGSHRMYSAQRVDPGPSSTLQIGQGLGQRHDSVLNFLRTGGRRGETEEPIAVRAARTNYFREDYAYGNEVRAPGIEPYLHHEGFLEAARALFGRPIVEPAIVFANLLVPGQELAVHTDVPEFRGCNRKAMPQWLLVAMHHSGLFESWRMPIATGVAWYHDCDGGEFTYWPQGADGPSVSHQVTYNTALLMDTDSVFHGVDPVARPCPTDGGGRDEQPFPPLKPGMTLDAVGAGRWAVHAPGEPRSEVASYKWEQLRFSVSWKAYCFTDEAERDRWRLHRDVLTVGDVVSRLVEDLRDRGLIEGDVPANPELELLMIDSYIHFPA